MVTGERNGRRRGGRWYRWLAIALAVAGIAGASPADAVTITLPIAGSWFWQKTQALPAGHAGQGSTTVVSSTGARLVTRGPADIPRVLAAAGWTHVGDPGSWQGSVLDAYQSSRSRAAKLFVLTTPDGTRRTYLHPLAPGEQPNNSFAAVAPGGRWFVSGEWGTMHRLLVFAMPTASTKPTIALAGTIDLTRPVRNVQGCAFDTATTLYCSTNDATTRLFARPRQLLAVQLAHGLGAGGTAATVTAVGGVPAQTVCPVVSSGPGEVEGIDLYRGRLTVSVNASCAPRTDVFTYVLRTPTLDIDPSTVWAVVDVPQFALQPQPEPTERM